MNALGTNVSHAHLSLYGTAVVLRASWYHNLTSDRSMTISWLYSMPQPLDCNRSPLLDAILIKSWHRGICSEIKLLITIFSQVSNAHAHSALFLELTCCLVRGETVSELRISFTFKIMRNHFSLPLQLREGNGGISIGLPKIKKNNLRKALLMSPVIALLWREITTREARCVQCICVSPGNGETNIYFHLEQSWITASVFWKGSQISQNAHGDVQCVTHLHKTLIQHKVSSRGPSALPPRFHFLPSSPPMGRCTPVPFMLSTSVAMETLLLFSPLPSYQAQLWTQCQDLLCTDSIFFQCLDKSVGKPCLHFFPQHHSFESGAIHFPWIYSYSGHGFFPLFSTIALK